MLALHIDYCKGVLLERKKERKKERWLTLHHEAHVILLVAIGKPWVVAGEFLVLLRPSTIVEERKNKERRDRGRENNEMRERERER